MSLPPRRRFRFFPANPWGDDLAPEVPAVERTSGRAGRRLRPQSAPAGGAVAICPHCWGLNLGGERLCGRCGADMTLVLQESGGLRRTAPVQSPVPVRTAHRLGVGTRAVLLVLTAVLALAWLVMPLLGGARYGARVWTRNHPTRRHEDTTTRRAGRPHAYSDRRLPPPGSMVAPEPEAPLVASSGRRVLVSVSRRPGAGTVTTKGRV